MAGRTVVWPRGFKTAAVRAGIKASGAADVALLAGEGECSAAAVFTRNRVVGAAVAVDREKIRSGRAQAIFVNSGNANTCTGRRGERDVHVICREVGRRLGIGPERVLVCSTGIIGHYLPMGKVRAGIEAATGPGGLRGTAAAGRAFARAILTTDTREKTAWEAVVLGGREVRLAGAAKGSGMIAPNMGTMLAFLTTDAAVRPGLLRRALGAAAQRTFNKVSVDNHVSTSDTAIVLASGRAGNRELARADGQYERFAAALTRVCDRLARQIAADGEGARCLVTVRATGAASEAEARRAVRAIVGSPLVRCAFHGADPNWGRIVSAVGYSGARFSPERLTCRVAGVRVFRGGRPRPFEARELHRRMKAKEWEVQVDLGVGRSEDFCYTCDLSHGYVTINADYHT